ncbi:MAG: hypothetical protein IJF29_05850 [Firmicutes bacterium]|nr:hypothetical protein [Bacillota bacterium]
MPKQLRFTDSDEDKDLIKDILEYQKDQGISSFIGAVRKLCKDALTFKKITK